MFLNFKLAEALKIQVLAINLRKIDFFHKQVPFSTFFKINVLMSSCNICEIILVKVPPAF